MSPAAALGVEEALDLAGFGAFQWRLFVICGLGWSADVGEILLEVEGGEDIKNGGGIAGGRTVRVKDIAYSPGAEGPAALVEKWCSTDDTVPKEVSGRLFIWALGLRVLADKAAVREVEVYRDLAAALSTAGVRIPRLFYAGVDGSADMPTCCFLWRPDSIYCRTVLLLEDLSTSGFSSCGHAVLDWASALDADIVAAGLRTIARIHAWGWGRTGEPPSKGLYPPFFGGHWAQRKFVLKKIGTSKVMERFIDLWQDRPERTCLQNPEVLEMLWDLRANIHRWCSRIEALDREQTMVHGDFHRGNIFAKREDGSVEVCTFDWSFFGTGHVAWEVVYFLREGWARKAPPFSAIDAEEEAQLRLYHEALLAARPDVGYSLEQLTADVKLIMIAHFLLMLEDSAKPEKLAEMVMAKEVPGLGEEGVLGEVPRWEYLTGRLVALRKDKSTWGEYFSGAGPDPSYAGRTAEQTAAAKGALQAKVQAKIADMRAGKASATQKLSAVAALKEDGAEPEPETTEERLRP